MTSATRCSKVEDRLQQMCIDGTPKQAKAVVQLYAKINQEGSPLQTLLVVCVRLFGSACARRRVLNGGAGGTGRI